MTKIILNGANGAMGKVVSELIALDPTVEIVAGVDLNTDVDLGFPVFDDIRKIDMDADAVIDFASVKAVDNLLDFIEEKKIPAVICTTAAGFDIEIVEAHHRRKLDAPSGTAILLADAVNENMDEKLSYTYDRSGRHEPRRADEIGLSAVRGGTIVGDHDVIFAGEDEVITFSHRAYSRKIFANGAISAAKFLQGKTAGLYDMSDVIK